MRSIATVCLLALCLVAPSALAAYSVHSPTVTAGKNEFELSGFDTWGRNPHSGTLKELKVAFGRGLTDFWASEIELPGKQKAGGSFQINNIEWENKFQLTPENQYGYNIGLFAAAEYKRGGGWEAKVGPMFDKTFGRFHLRTNLLFSHEYGHDADSGMGVEYSARAEYKLTPAFSPLIEAYGKPVGRTGAWGRPRNLLGPGFKSKFHVGNKRELEFGMVLLFGVSGAAADTVLVARLEYSFF
jgi:hypothetical protein